MHQHELIKRARRRRPPHRLSPSAFALKESRRTSADRRAAGRLRVLEGRYGSRATPAHHGAARAAETDARFGSERYDRPGRLLAIQGRERPHHRQYAAHHVPGRHRRPSVALHHNLEAYSLYLKRATAEQAQPGGRARSISFFQQAIDHDPRLRAGILRLSTRTRSRWKLPQRAVPRGTGGANSTQGAGS